MGENNPIGNHATRSYRLSVLALAGMALLLCLYCLDGGIGMDEHECLVAEPAREMLESGDWMIPRFAGMVRLRKTPLPYWTVAAISAIGGEVTTWTARLPSALSGAATVLVICWLGSMLFGRRAGLVCGFVMATSLATLFYSHDAAADMQLTFWCSLCYALFYRALVALRAEGGSNASASGQPCPGESGRPPAPARWWFYAFYAAFGAAMLAKGPMPGPVVALPLLVYLAIFLQ